MGWTDKGTERERELREIAGRLGKLRGEGEYEWCENEGAVRGEGGKERPVATTGGEDWIWHNGELWVKAGSKKGTRVEPEPVSAGGVGVPAARSLEDWVPRGQVAEMLADVWGVLKEYYAEGWRLEMNWDGVDADEDRDEFQRGELEIRLMTTDRSKVVVGRGEEWVNAGEAIRFVVNAFLGEMEGK